MSTPEPIRRRLFLKEHREAKGVSAEAMAGRLGIERESVYRLEREALTRLSAGKQAAYASALNIEPEALWRPPGGTSSTPDQLMFLHARRQLVLFAAEASGLPGLTPVERAQMRTIAGLAGLQLHTVSDHADQADMCKIDDDLKRVRHCFHSLVGALIRAVDDRASWQFESDYSENA